MRQFIGRFNHWQSPKAFHQLTNLTKDFNDYKRRTWNGISMKSSEFINFDYKIPLPTQTASCFPLFVTGVLPFLPCSSSSDKPRHKPYCSDIYTWWRDFYLNHVIFPRTFHCLKIKRFHFMWISLCVARLPLFPAHVCRLPAAEVLSVSCSSSNRHCGDKSTFYSPSSTTRCYFH